MSKINIKKKVIWLLTLILSMVLMIIILRPSYETNDDMNLIFIANGGLSYASSQLVYTNIIFGKLLKTLFSIIPDINWYTLISLLLVIISYYLYSINKVKDIKSYIYYLLIYFIIYLLSIINYNYTRISIVICFINCLCIIYNILDDKGYKSLILPAILLYCGSLIRFDGLLLSGLILSLIFIYIFILLIKDKDVKSIIVGILAVFIIGGSYIVDKKSYNNEQFSEYKQYESILHTINDYEYIQDYSTFYASQADFYVNQGISVNSFDLLRKYTYADSNVYSYNRLVNIANHINETAFQPGQYLTKLHNYFSSYSHILLVTINVICLIFIVIRKDKAINKLLLVSPIIINLLIVFIYLYLNRIPDRVGFSLGLTFIFMYDYLCKDSYIAKYISNIINLIAISTLLIMFTYTPVKNQDSMIEDLQSINSDTSHIYLYDGFSPLMSLTYSFNFIDMNVKSIDNTYRLGGWLYKLPVNESILKENGIDNAFACLIDNDKCLLASSETGSEKVLTYLQENYDSDIKVNLVQQYNNFNVYSYSK